MTHSHDTAAPAPAGEAVEPVACRWRLKSEFNGQWGHGPWVIAGRPPTVHGDTIEIEFLYDHPAPEDTARLREDLERVRLELSTANDKLETMYSEHAAEKLRADTAERERDDARKALETATEDERDRLYAEVVKPHTGLIVKDGRTDGWAGATRFWLEDKGARLPADRAAARSASREGASDE